MYKLGFSTIGCPDYSVEQVIELATANGYLGVELRFIRGSVELTELDEFSPRGIRDTRQRFEDANLEVVGIDTSVKMASLDTAVRRQQRESAKANLEIAEGLGASFLRVFGGPIPEGQDREASLDAISGGLGEIADLTAASGVTSLLELHDEFPTSESILDLFTRGTSDNLKVLWDTLHSYRHGEQPEVTWAKLGDRIRHVHVKDSIGATATRFGFALTGEGDVPILQIVGLLKRVGYDGFVNFEWEKGWHPEIEEPEIAIPHFARFMAGIH
jgi:sugar phosphate isomerase/epimerase